MNSGIDSETEPVVAEAAKIRQEVMVEPRGACERHVTVTVPREEIDRYFQKQFDELMPKAEVPGFRPGRAPRQLVENKFRKQVADQVKGALLMDSLSQVNDGKEFAAISEPDLDFDAVKLPDDGPLTYEFNIEVRPEFELPAWKGLKLERPNHTFSEADLDRAVNQLYEAHSELTAVDEPAQAGDYMALNIVSSFGGQVVAESGEVLVALRDKLICADTTLEGFGALMLGARAGDRRVTNAVISEFSERSEFQSQTLEVAFEVLEVKRVSESDRRAAMERVGVEDEAGARRYVAAALENRLGYHRGQRIREQISQLLTEFANWELPPALLRRQSRRELERAVMEMRANGLSEEEVQTQENRLRQDVLTRTAHLLKEHFILERIAEEEKVQDLPEDYDREIARIAAQRNDSPRRVRARLERMGMMDSLRNMIIEQKVIAMIESHAEFRDAPYEGWGSENYAALEHFIAGQAEAEIPEARYDPVAGDAFRQKYGPASERG